MNKKAIIGIIVAIVICASLVIYIKSRPDITIGDPNPTITINEQIVDSLIEENKNISVVKKIKVSSQQPGQILIGVKNSHPENMTCTLKIEYAQPEPQSIENLTEFFVQSKVLLHFNPGESRVIPVQYVAGKVKGTTNYVASIISNGDIYASANFSITVQ